VDNFRFAIELARSGKLGKLQSVHAGIIPPMEYLPDLPAGGEPDPEELNWDAWLGPAAVRPYNVAYVQGRWRGYKGFVASYSVCEWGSHTVDLCQWAADADGTTPIEFTAEGTTLHGQYANGVKLQMRRAGFKNEGKWAKLGTCPVRFEGDEGWIEAGDNGTVAVSDNKLLAGGPPSKMHGTDPAKHVREFVDCVKSRATPAGNATAAKYGHITCHAAAIAWRLGRTLRYDPATHTFPGDAEANGMRSYQRRAPYTV
jgi:predicted dehydrogenase